MSAWTSGEVTQLLHDVHGGNDRALATVFTLVYDELQRLAHTVRRGRAGETLNTTALVHEVFLRLAPAEGLHFNDRQHFFRIAARAMRQILVEAARRKNALKRGGGDADLPFDEQIHHPLLDQPERLLALDTALAILAARAPRQAAVVECRFFAGLTAAETAATLDVSEPTVTRDWRVARAWLAAQLRDDAGRDD